MYKIVVDASNRKFKLNLKEILQYKDLLFILSYRDLRVRYAQTFLGLAWAFIQPAAHLLIFTLVFGKALNVQTEGVAYPIFAICGMTAWTYFSFVMSEAGKSVIGAQEMVKKIYFPRLIIPLSKAIVGLVDFGVSLVFLSILFILYGQYPSVNVIVFPIFLILTILSALGFGIILSSLTIRYRDFQYLVPFLVQFGLYATPIAYPSELIIKNLPEWAVIIFYCNPMAGIVEGLRWSLLDGNFQLSEYSYISFSVTIILFFISIYYFRKTERIMADLV